MGSKLMLKILHNPKCSKSRATLEILKSKGLNPEVVKYLENPLNEKELNEVVEKLSLKARDIVRVKEDEFKKLEIDLDDDKAVIAAIAAHPRIMERPIVVTDTAAKIGRPPEQVLEIL